MKYCDLDDRLLAFACRVIALEKRLSKKARVKKHTLDQLTSAASSIGANWQEARGGHGPADYHAKVRIALKEARESKYWLQVVANTSGMREDLFTAIIKESGEIVAMLTTIAKKANRQG